MHISRYALFELLYGLIVTDVDITMFECPEEPLYGDVVDRPAFTIHRDIDTMVFQDLNMFMRSVLASLVRVEYLWLGILG